jgi:hypothetical protein
MTSMGSLALLLMLAVLPSIPKATTTMTPQRPGMNYNAELLKENNHLFSSITPLSPLDLHSSFISNNSFIILWQ